MASGQGQMGQLGITDMRDKWVPELLDPKLKSNVEATITASTMFGGQKVVMMAAGLMHSLILTASGEVHSSSQRAAWRRLSGFCRRFGRSAGA